MNKYKPALAWIFFLLSIMFLGLLIILGSYFINDYININNANDLSGIDYLVFGALYSFGFITLSVLGLISSVLSTVFATSKNFIIISSVETLIFVLGIIFSLFLYCG
ncbi:MAG: hypothetical protein J6B80_02070 [Clostridia bacterium]|nr:hypothetical protein [Clostridia bacterium]